MAPIAPSDLWHCRLTRWSAPFSFVEHSGMELEATQAAGLVLGVKSYGASDELDYHSAWDHIKVAAEAEHGLLKKRPALADVAHDEGSNTCRATCANGRPCNNQVHPDAGRGGHCAWTCGLHKNKRPEDLRAPEETQRPDEDEEVPPADDGEQSDADLVVSDSDDEEDLFARDDVDAKVAAGMADERPPVACAAGGGVPPRNRGQPRPQTDLLKFFNADGGTTTGSCNLYKDSEGKPVFMCAGYNYAYRDSRLRAFTPVEFRQRFKVEKMDQEKVALHKLWCSAARYISAWWRLEDRRGRAAAYEQRLCELENLRKRKLVYLRKKIKTLYGYDPECDDPDRIAHQLDAEAHAHLHLLNPKQLAVVAYYHQLKGMTDAIDSPPIASPKTSKLHFDPFIADCYGVVHLKRAARYIQAAWRLRHYRPVIHHRLRSFHVMRGSWLRSKLMMATQTFLALWGSVAPSERKRPYGKRLLAITALSPHYFLPITPPSPHYRLTIAGWQSGTSSVRPTRSTSNTSSCQRQSGVCLRCRVSHHQRSRRVDLMRRAPRQEHALATWRVTTSQTSLHGRPSSRRSSTMVRGSGTARISDRRRRSIWHDGKTAAPRNSRRLAATSATFWPRNGMTSRARSSRRRAARSALLPPCASSPSTTSCAASEHPRWVHVYMLG